jgi:hypothetical protein
VAAGTGIHGASRLDRDRGEGGAGVDGPNFLHLVNFLVVGEGGGDIAGGGGRVFIEGIGGEGRVTYFGNSRVTTKTTRDGVT